MRATPPSRTRTGVGERKTPNVASGAGPSGANRGLGGTTSLTVLVPRKAGTSRFAARGDLGSQGNPRECSGPSPLPCRCRPPARCRPHPALSCTPHARPRSHQWPGERGPGVGQGAPHGRRRATSTALCSKKKTKAGRHKGFVVRGFSPCERARRVCAGCRAPALPAGPLSRRAREGPAQAPTSHHLPLSKEQS